MRRDTFEALAPVCPRCLHGEGRESPLVIADVAETRGGLIWHAILHCSHAGCWTEYPVIDGVPVVTGDPAAFLRNAQAHVLARDDLPAPLDSLIGDALGPGGDFDTTRQHVSIYAEAHFSDWAGGGKLCIVGTLAAGLDALGEVGGPAIDLGGGIGRGGWELATAGLSPVLVSDMNFAFLRLAQRLMLDGRVRYARRRVGLVYEPVEVALPPSASAARPDFWAVDAMALPFRAGAFGLATAVNLVDSIAGPAELVAETARILAPGAGAVFTAPFDWAPTAAEPARWMGGHSQRAATGGAPEPVLRATLAQWGLTPVAERPDLPWTLRLHDRATMHYSMHMVACRRTPARREVPDRQGDTGAAPRAASGEYRSN